jgi:acetyl esterase
MGSVHSFSVPRAAAPVAVRIYRPLARADVPLVLYVHGGGWVTGDLDVVDRPCRRLAAGTGAVVVSVDYRLSPEHRYPAALEDCTGVLEWLRSNAPRLGARRGAVAVVGDSAGGHLAIALAVNGVRGAGPPVDALALLYPVVHPEQDSPFRSYVVNGTNPVLPRATMEWFWAAYTGPDADLRDPCLSPLTSGDLAGFPPALIVTCGLDVLRDEGRELARLLAARGVRVSSHDYPGMTHGFFWMDALIPQADEVVDLVGRFLRDDALTRNNG